MSFQLTTKSLTDMAQEELSWLTTHGFRFFKSSATFRRQFANGFSYVAINSITHNRVDYHLAFYLGVRIDEVEVRLKQILGDNSEINHYSRTIWNYTVNIGPLSPHWSYPIPGTWSLRNLSEFPSIGLEVSKFMQELGLPFINEHDVANKIRKILMESPGHATNIWPYQQILAIDSLENNASQMEADIAVLDKRYQKYSPGPRAQFDNFVKRARSYGL